MAEGPYRPEIFNMYKLFTFIIILVCTISLASSYTYLNIYLDEEGNALFLGETNQTSIQLPEGIEVSNGKIIGKTSSLTKKNSGVFQFEYQLKDSEFEVILPENALLKSSSSSDVFSRGSYFSIYAKDEINVSYKIQRNLSWIYILLIVIVSILIFYIFRYNLIHKNDKKEFNLKNILNEREKKIIESLGNKKIKMSYLRKMTDIPKASFSRHIQVLERKKLIKRSGEGKNKFVEINKGSLSLFQF